MNQENPTKNPPLDFLYKEDSAVDFLDTSKSQLIPSQPTSAEEPDISISTIVDNCESVWSLKGQLTAYQKGVFMGRGDGSNLMLEEFLKKFRKTLEYIVREELKMTNQTSENYKDIFIALESVFNILTAQLQNEKGNAKNVLASASDRFLPIFHGFINSYVSAIMNTDKNG